ncbi:SGNH/GDSL hydrolase family protein [Aporhodopirellula aestuarii]|uniref:SGNH/GDSL hydrolase family protein n=1 Tax=Aporhodopirellula aestuarii TaxID=2950107 RepID=A0ABT0UAL7_9BACT|nr:SGNH/GDSL hydrolase family protein [Aporhodopirellula aestuarii]MCM2373953.1 SGNH/GDSL hydrolase family protein [Aporhodopirellula aestuarii]
MQKRMTMLVLAVLLSGVTVLAVESTNRAEDAWYKLVGERFSKRPEFAFVENDPTLPNVLIYGDSISIHYTQRLREKLNGQANVYRLFRNGGDSSTFIANMSKMHDAMHDERLDHPWDFQWDVIHFNVGLHDLKYLRGRKLDKTNGKQVSSLETYQKNLGEIVEYLRTLAPDAKLLFATTTPVAPDEPGRKVGDSARFNAAAREVLAGYPDVSINDLHSFTKPHHSEWWVAPNNVHYNEAGSNAQGDEVARVILESLEN